jgi:class 3 adenylate cyclase
MHCFTDIERTVGRNSEAYCAMRCQRHRYLAVRGGVTIGGMQHDDQTVFGLGVNEAYRLESTIAKVARVVLGSRAIGAARRYAGEDPIWAAYSNARLLRDHDGV